MNYSNSHTHTHARAYTCTHTHTRTHANRVEQKNAHTPRISSRSCAYVCPCPSSLPCAAQLAHGQRQNENANNNNNNKKPQLDKRQTQPTDKLILQINSVIWICGLRPVWPLSAFPNWQSDARFHFQLDFCICLLICICAYLFTHCN